MKNILRILIVGLLSLAVVAVSKNIYSQILRFNEIHQAETQVEELAKENEELQTQMKKEKNKFFAEREARDKLGYQKPGETLYVVDLEEAQAKEAKKLKQNWQKWIDLLFR